MTDLSTSTKSKLLVKLLAIKPDKSRFVLIGKGLLRPIGSYNKNALMEHLLTHMLHGLTIVELKGDGQTKVRCQVYGKLSFLADPLKVGQKVKLFGQYVTYDKALGVTLDKALPITRDAE